MTGGVARGFRVRGRVQGVGFRWWAGREAKRLALGGAIWNREDGSVEVHVVGAVQGVEEFRRLLDSGPRGAQVHHVEEVPCRSGLAGSQFVVLG